MWRALSVAHGDIVVFMDADTDDPDPAHLLGLLGPLLGDPGVHFVKAAFERPFRTRDGVVAHEGGRVTELMARPLLNLHFPALAGFAQPLAGETAARRDLLRSLPFAAGYGVEIGLLIDALRRVGLDGLAEARVGTRQNRHQSLRALGAMAFAVLAAVERRVARDGARRAGGPRPRPAVGRRVGPRRAGRGAPADARGRRQRGRGDRALNPRDAPYARRRDNRPPRATNTPTRHSAPPASASAGGVSARIAHPRTIATGGTRYSVAPIRPAVVRLSANAHVVNPSAVGNAPR